MSVSFPALKNKIGIDRTNGKNTSNESMLFIKCYSGIDLYNKFILF